MSIAESVMVSIMGLCILSCLGILISLLEIDFFYILRKIKPFFHIKKHNTMINTKALIKAMQFLCLPTLSLLIIIFFWFFSWTDFIAFLTSKSGWAGALRVGVVILEVILVYYMYEYYCKIIPNEAYNKRFYEKILGENFQHFKTSDEIRPNRTLKIREQYSFSNDIDEYFKNETDTPEQVVAYKIHGVKNCIVLKKVKLI